MEKESKYCGFRFSIYETNPKTGEKLHDLEEVMQKVREYSILEDYAMIIHDKDILTKNDIEKHINMLRNRYEKEVDNKTEDGLEIYISENQYLFEGQPKGKHLHCAMRTKKGNRRTIVQVARALGILPQEIELIMDEKKRPSGELKHFLDVVYYFTHKDEDQKDLGKAEYDWSEIEGTKDWKKEWDLMREQIGIFGNRYNLKDAIFHAVAYEGMSLKEIREKYPEIYVKQQKKLKELASDYLSRQAPLPPLRINYYLDGPGGIGKNVASRALAKSHFPDLSDDECYFEVGGNNVSFEGYEGQPVVIWNDMRAVDLIMKFGRGEVFDIFDSHPTNAKHNIKYGSVRLVNPINIVNGIQPYEEFLDSLAGEYEDRFHNVNKAEDKGQAYRRFPIILCLRESDFDVLLNKGVAEGTREYEQYIAHKNIQGSFALIAKRLEGEAKEVVMLNMLRPALKAAETIKVAESEKISEKCDIPDEFKNYGKTESQIKAELLMEEDGKARESKEEAYIIGQYPIVMKKDEILEQDGSYYSEIHLYLKVFSEKGQLKLIPYGSGRCVNECKSKLYDNANDEIKSHVEALQKARYIKINGCYHPLHHTDMCIPSVEDIPKWMYRVYFDRAIEAIDITREYDLDVFYGNISDDEPTDEEIEEYQSENEWDLLE